MTVSIFGFFCLVTAIAIVKTKRYQLNFYVTLLCYVLFYIMLLLHASDFKYYYHHFSHHQQLHFYFDLHNQKVKQLYSKRLTPT